MSARRLRIIACALGVAVALAACGQTSSPTSVLNNGVYVDAGPITYQLQVSRELNPYATEDRQYLAGLPAGTSQPNANELWYGVFLWAKNQTNQEQPTASSFTILDSNGDHFSPIKLDPSVNGYAWTQQTLGPSGIEPAPNTTASLGPTQGGLLLFKLPTSVYSNRPLTLQIVAPDGGKGEISLDL
ncbi:MAG: hypothetical protein JO027_21890 [Solirubrobacterales bacterium]|nr:hypothetical protein [Solirubrobacterales bacterium]MBV9801911.1 hypothetical protein [Solirubrobacterales bacterium]